ncbi:MAG: BACON domain-containing protein [Prevotella sp.]|nr:BACON domain-containing protein [Prevotella sp.]
MKLKYFIPALMAVVAAVFTGCSDDDDPTYLDEVRVSSSYVTFAQEGGSTTITLNAKADWAFDAASVPEWITVTPMSGTAGESEVTFTTDVATANREAELLLNCAEKTQRINVVQQAEETDPVIMTVAEAVALIKSGNIPETALYVKGIVCRIQEISVQYGNATYFLSDDGKYSADGVWLEVYRGYWLNAAKFTKGDEFAVGDELVIKGVLMDYQGTPETKQGTCEVISVTKSLIGVDGVELLGVEEGEGVTEFPLEGGEIKINVNSKGNGFHIAIPEAAKSWLHISDFGSNYVTLQADGNTGGDRNVTVTLSTESAGTTYTCEQSFTQKGAILEVNVADFLAAEEGDTQYRITGVITEFYASDSQGKSFYIADHTGKTLVYRTEGFIESGAKVGDVVTVVGKRGAYKGNPQLVSGTFESLKYAVKEVSIADFRNLDDNKEAYYLISGTITEATEDGTKNDVTQYGNFNLTDDSGSVYVYGVLKGWGGAKGQFGELNLTWGDKLTIIAYKTTYKGLVEAVGVYLSHEKAE